MTNCPNGLRAQVFFPGCWDGKNLDSPDHKSHMAYPDGIDNGLCPPSHPIHLVSLFYEVWFDVASFNSLNDGGRFVLANGDSTGYGLHGDFLNGWDNSVLSRAVAQCTANSGVIEDCPVFKNEGRFTDDSVMNSCAAKNPLPEEQTGPGALLSHLPGCVAVTDGPAPATPADLVPGCVVGSGSVSPIPSSSATSSASSSAAANSHNAATLVVVATPSQVSHSPSSSMPPMSAQPTTTTTTTTTTQMKPAPPSSSPSQSSHSSSSKHPMVAKPTHKMPAHSSALPGQASHSSMSSLPALIAQPTTTQMNPMNPAPSPSSSTTEAPNHYGGCGVAPHSAFPTSSMSSMLAHRRRHMKHGYRSPAHF
jgi:hypothetical protein